jgi:DNA-binding MarR family transcriptional regulator
MPGMTLCAMDERPAERSLLELLSYAHHHMTGQVGLALRTRKSSLEEWRVLSLLADGAGHTMSEIADFTTMPPPSATKLISRLVAAKLVYRRVDVTDRRRVLVFLAARGRAAYRRLRPVVEDSIAGLDPMPFRDLGVELLRRVGSPDIQRM